jgi:tripartite-type tricarboxylate transporter receptor subunit TctC
MTGALSGQKPLAGQRNPPTETTMFANPTLRRCLTLCLIALPLSAAAFPDKPIEWVVPYPAGGGSDAVARTLAEQMGKTLGQILIINNKPGAATNIGADYVAKARADGHVMLTADTATLAANPALYAKLPYNAEKDFAPVGLMARFPMILVVGTGVPAKTLAEFLAWVKQQPDGVNYASPGAGSPHHLATELFRERSGVKLVHVPYRGAAPALQDVVGGQVPFMFVDTASGYPYILSGKLRAIGIASPKRVVGFDTIPTLAEQGLKGFEAYAWQGLVVPVATPPEVVSALNKALNQALASTAVKARFQTLGLETIPSTSAQMATYAKAEREKWRQVIRASNIRLD